MATQQGALAPIGVVPTWSLRTSFCLVIAAQVLLFPGSNLPTPLFAMYEHRYGFGSGVVTLLFCSYVAVLVPTVVVLGPITAAMTTCLSHRKGRRPRRLHVERACERGLDTAVLVDTGLLHRGLA